MADLKNLKGISQADKQLLTEAEEWLGAEPTKMGPVKNFFWGVVKEDFYFPYPTQDAREQAECDQLLARLDDYLKNEHPAVAIDQEQEIPRWVVDKLFKLGVLGMTIPKEYGGLGLGITNMRQPFPQHVVGGRQEAHVVAGKRKTSGKIFGSPAQSLKAGHINLTRIGCGIDQIAPRRLREFGEQAVHRTDFVLAHLRVKVTPFAVLADICQVAFVDRL